MENLEHRIKVQLIEALELDMDPDEIDDDAPLFGDEGLGLDSVDALEVAATLQMEFGVEIPNRQEANKVLASIHAMADFVRGQGKS